MASPETGAKSSLLVASTLNVVAGVDNGDENHDCANKSTTRNQELETRLADSGHAASAPATRARNYVTPERVLKKRPSRNPKKHIPKRTTRSSIRKRRTHRKRRDTSSAPFLGNLVSIEQTPTDSGDVEEEVFWEIEAFQKMEKRGDQVFYQIKWKGTDEVTWEPEDSLCDSALDEARQLFFEKPKATEATVKDDYDSKSESSDEIKEDGCRVGRRKRCKHQEEAEEIAGLQKKLRSEGYGGLAVAAEKDQQVESVYWEIEKFIDTKVDEDGKVYHLIKWKGANEISWEPEDNLCDSALESSKSRWNGGDGEVVCVDKGDGYCSDASENDEIYWEIEAFKKRRRVKGEEQFLIKWKGSKTETWENADNLCDSAILEARELFNQKKRAVEQQEGAFTVTASDQVIKNFQRLPNVKEGTVTWKDESTNYARVNILYTFPRSQEIGHRKRSSRKAITALELFAGIGGMSHGFLQNGHFDVNWIVEADSVACTHQQILHRDASVYQEKVEEFLDKCEASHAGYPGKLEVNHVHASPPCQGFSRANRWGGSSADENRRLSYTFCKALKFFRPATASYENVEGIFQSKHVRFLQNIVTDMIKLDYQVRVMVLDASRYGDPQRRRRVIMLASLKGWPIPACPPCTHGPNESTKLAPVRTVRDVLKDLETVSPESGSGLVRLKDDSLVYNHQTTEEVSPDFKESNRIKADSPAHTLLTTSRIVHYSENRHLTVRETARLFGIPDSVQLFGTVGDQYKYLGNSVPVGLATAVANSVATMYGRD